MRAVRKDYFLDHDHSAYVDQWDWERAITAEQRTLDHLKDTVRAIWRVIRWARGRSCTTCIRSCATLATRTSPTS